jgi:hypothetical protein
MLPRHLLYLSLAIDARTMPNSSRDAVPLRTASDFMSLIFQYLKISYVFYQIAPPSNIKKKVFSLSMSN